MDDLELKARAMQICAALQARGELTFVKRHSMRVITPRSTTPAGPAPEVGREALGSLRSLRVTGGYSN